QQPYVVPGQGAYQGQPGQPPQYPGYPPTGYGQGYPGYGADPNYANYGAAGVPVAAGTTLRLFGQSFTVPVALPPIIVPYPQRLPRQRASRRISAQRRRRSSGHPAMGCPAFGWHDCR